MMSKMMEDDELELYLPTPERESVRCVWSEVNSNFSSHTANERTTSWS